MSAMLKAACEQRTKYGLDHPQTCFCQLQPSIKEQFVRKSLPPKALLPKSTPVATPRAHSAAKPPQRLLSAAPDRAPAPPRKPPSTLSSPRRAPPPIAKPGVACASQCEVQGDHMRQGLLQQPSTFFVVVRDGLGEPILRGGDTVRVSSRGPGPLRPSVVDESDGTYTVAYLATVSGTYQLSVTCNAQPVPGSPLTITVEPSSAHAPASVADGQGLLRAVAGEPTSFFVRAHDVLGRPKVMGGEVFEAHATLLDDDGGHVAPPPSPSMTTSQRGFESVLASPLRSMTLSTLGSPGRGALELNYSASSPRGAKGAPPATPLQVVDLGNGSYEGRYSLPVAGKYALSITRNGVHIRDSPFALRIRPGASSASACLLDGEGLIAAEAGVRTTFRLVPTDMYSNPKRVAPTTDTDGLLVARRAPTYAAAYPEEGEPPEAFEASLYPLRVEHRDTPPIRCAVTPSALGTHYDVTYLAAAAGEYEVGVTLRGEGLTQRPTLVVVPGGAKPAASTASGEGIVSAVAGVRTTFTVHARDEFANFRDGHADEFDVALRPARRLHRSAEEAAAYSDPADERADAQWIYEYADAVPPTPKSPRPPKQRARSLEPVGGEVSALGDGKYLVEYIVDDAGSYLIDVYAARQLIAGAPFKLTVLPAPLHAPSCRMVRAGPASVAAGQTALLKFESCDRHGNRRTNGGDPFAIQLEVDPSNAEPSARAYAALTGGALGDTPVLMDVSDGVVQAPPQPAVLDGCDGVYTVAYGWSHAGGLLLSICDAHGSPIHGSPFHLDVVADAPSAAQSAAHGAWLSSGGVAGVAMHVTVVLRDQYHNVCAQLPDGVSCALRGPVEVQGTIGSFTRGGLTGVEAVMTPSVAGRYWLHLAHNGEPIGASPYSVYVRPGAASPHHAELWGEGLTTAVAGEVAYFAVQLRDSLKNATADGASEVRARVEPPPRMARASLDGLPMQYVGGDGAAEEGAIPGEGCECTIQTTHDPAEPSGTGRHDPGLFSGVWRTMRTGRHLMHLTLRSEPLVGSPYAILVKAGPTHAPASTLYLEGGASRLVRPNEPIIVRIYARDRWGNVRGEGGDDFHVFVQGAARPSLQELEDLRSGEYELRLRLPLSGSYSVHVNIAKAPLHGAPLKIHVAAG